jgi:phosphate uptake regulator
VATREGFDRELETIDTKVIELFALVAQDLPTATAALLDGDDQAAAVLAERQQAIHVLYPEIEQLAHRSILLQAPVGSDLRYLL